MPPPEIQSDIVLNMKCQYQERKERGTEVRSRMSYIKPKKAAAAQSSND